MMVRGVDARGFGTRAAPGAPFSDRSLRQGRQGDTVEAIAPDAATLRSRHVARRMDCGSSWTLLRITVVAVVDVGRAQVAARCAGGPQGQGSQLVFPLHFRNASPQLRHEIWSRSARAALPPRPEIP